MGEGEKGWERHIQEEKKRRLDLNQSASQSPIVSPPLEEKKKKKKKKKKRRTIKKDLALPFRFSFLRSWRRYRARI